MIEYVLLKVRQSVENVVIPLLKKSENHGFRYVIPKLKNVPKKRLTKYIVQQIYNIPAPGYGCILYSNFFYSYHDTDVMALKDISAILGRPVYIVYRYRIS